MFSWRSTVFYGESAVKRALQCVLGAFVLLETVLHAEIEESTYGSEKMVQVEEIKPYKITVYGDTVAKAKIDKKDFDDQHLTYSDIGVEATCGFYYDPAF